MVGVIHSRSGRRCLAPGFIGGRRLWESSFTEAGRQFGAWTEYCVAIFAADSSAAAKEKSALSSVNPSTPVKIAMAVTENGSRVSGHAGKARHWLIFECLPGQPSPGAEHITLTQEQLPHHFQDAGPHPLKGVDIVVAGSAGDGFIRHMAKWGAQVLLTGESDPAAALQRILSGVALPDTRFDVTTTLCKLRELFSRH